MYVTETQHHSALGSLQTQLSSSSVASLDAANRQLERRFRKGDNRGLADRARKLKAAVAAVGAADRPAVISAIATRQKGFAFSELVHDRISRGLRRQLVHLLQQPAPTSTPATPRTPSNGYQWDPNYYNRVPTFDVERAKRRNRHWKVQLGWQRYRDKIAQFLRAKLKWPAIYSLEQAVALWQLRQRLEHDGIIGPKTWRRLQVEMNFSVPCASYQPGEQAKAASARGHLAVDLLSVGGGWLFADFAVNSNRVKPSMQPHQAFRSWLTMEVAKGNELTITGYSDCVGTERGNLALRKSRARAVFDLLTPAFQARVAEVEAGPLGRYPINRNETPTERAKNRSVVVRSVVDFEPLDTRSKTLNADSTSDTKPKPSGGCNWISLPALKASKRVFKISKSHNFGAVRMKFEGTVTVVGEVFVCSPPSTKIGVKLDEGAKGAQFELALKNEFLSPKIKGSITPGQISSVGIQISRSELSFELSANADLSRPFSMKLKPTNPPKQTIRFGEFTFIGKIVPQLEVSLGPNPTYAWSAVASRLTEPARQGISVAARGLLFGGEIGMATGLGVVFVGAAAAILGIGIPALGLYMISTAHRDGRTLSALYNFNTGYARMLASLTSGEPVFNDTESGIADYWRLLQVDWRARFTRGSKAWVEEKDRRALLSLSSLGEAKAVQDQAEFNRGFGGETWKQLSDAHRRRYGNGTLTRANRYAGIMNTQARRGQKLVGIPLRPEN